MNYEVCYSRWTMRWFPFASVTERETEGGRRMCPKASFLLPSRGCHRTHSAPQVSPWTCRFSPAVESLGSGAGRGEGSPSLLPDAPAGKPALPWERGKRDRERPRTSAGRCRPKRGARERCSRRRVSVGFADRAQTALLGGGSPGVRGHEDNSVRGRRVEQNLRLRVGDRNARC